MQDITVEISPTADLSADPGTWTWVDVTALGLVRLVDGVRISRGRPDEASTVPPARCQLVVDNRGGHWVEDNPYGIWFDQITIGTPLRVSVDPGSGAVVRFFGQIYELPPRWDVSERNRWVPLVAQGVLRRLGQGTAPASTATEMAAEADPNLFGFWPCTDSAGSHQAASTMPGVAALTASADVVFAEVVGPDGTSQLPDISGVENNDTAFYGNIPVASVTAGWGIEAAVRPAASHSSNAYPLEVLLSGGNIKGFTVRFDSANTVVVSRLHSSGETTVFTYATTPWDNNWHTWRLTAIQDGADVDLVLYKDGVSVGTGTATSKTLGRMKYFNIGAPAPDGLTSVGAIAAYSTNAAPTAETVTAITGGVGEQAHERFARVAAAADIEFETLVTESITMGAQPEAAVLPVLLECAAADAGVLVETVDGKLALHGRTLRENADVVLALDKDQYHLQPSFAPAADDRLRRNDVTASRSSGSSARYVDEADVTKRGTYNDSVTVNVQSDSMLYDRAGWQVHLGTVKGLRHPVIGINLTRTPDLIDDALTVDISSRITLSNPPEGMAPDPVDVLVEQITEYVDPFVWTITFATSPYAPWQIIEAAADTGDTNPLVGHYDWDTCVLAEVLDTTETGVNVTTTPLITTVADDFPFDILVGGERMTVTACSGASNPQTLTVTRSVNTVVKGHANGTTVELHPASARYLGL